MLGILLRDAADESPSFEPRDRAPRPRVKRRNTGRRDGRQAIVWGEFSVAHVVAGTCFLTTNDCHVELNSGPQHDVRYSPAKVRILVVESEADHRRDGGGHSDTEPFVKSVHGVQGMAAKEIRMLGI